MGPSHLHKHIYYWPFYSIYWAVHVNYKLLRCAILNNNSTEKPCIYRWIKRPLNQQNRFKNQRTRTNFEESLILDADNNLDCLEFIRVFLLPVNTSSIVSRWSYCSKRLALVCVSSCRNFFAVTKADFVSEAVFDVIAWTWSF